MELLSSDIYDLPDEEQFVSALSFVQGVPSSLPSQRSGVLGRRSLPEIDDLTDANAQPARLHYSLLSYDRQSSFPSIPHVAWLAPGARLCVLESRLPHALTTAQPPPAGLRSAGSRLKGGFRPLAPAI